MLKAAQENHFLPGPYQVRAAIRFAVVRAGDGGCDRDGQPGAAELVMALRERGVEVVLAPDNNTPLEVRWRTRQNPADEATETTIAPRNFFFEAGVLACVVLLSLLFFSPFNESRPRRIGDECAG